MNIRLRVGLACYLCVGFAAASHAGVATFDDLPSPPATDSSTGLEFANGGSLVYQGVTWDSRISVVGGNYKVSPPDGPSYGIPHSGAYFITNQGDGAANDHILLTTNQILLGAWFGQNAYYGFSTGATQVTIVALGGSTELASNTLVFNPPAVDGQPGIMQQLSTANFQGLAGITGYRIDRVSTDAVFNGNWTADDFTFTTAVPEPSSACLLGLGLIALGGSRLWNSARRRRIG